MKKILFLFSVILFLFPNSVSAHLIGQPPFFKVNGIYSQLYSVPTASTEEYDLPQDSTPTNYLVNQPIQFELDASKLPGVTPEVLAATTFSWEFGDGQKAQGLKQTHTYTKIGSYIIKIFADDGTTPTPQLLESALVQVLPNKNYQLPTSVITVNGKRSSNPVTDILTFPLNQPLQFDGSASSSKSSHIVSYFWDFGDEKTATGVKLMHIYSSTLDLPQAFPVLRVTDANGFFTDSYLQIQNKTGSEQSQSSNNPPDQTIKSFPSSSLLYVLGGIGIVIVLFIVVRGVSSNKSKHRR